jgi:hypothetical protein
MSQSFVHHLHMCSFDEVGAMARATVGSEAAAGWGGVRSSSGGGGFGGGEANLDAEGTNREGLMEGSLLKRETTREENERHTIARWRSEATRRVASSRRGSSGVR